MCVALVQMVVEEGVYANGQVVVQPLPEAIFGPNAERTLPIRRLDAVLTEEQLQEHCDKELQQVCLCLPPLFITNAIETSEDSILTISLFKRPYNELP